MRRLNPREDERGATAVVVAVMLTALLGMGALVIDLAALYQERRELQNGADAAALAIAADCAEGLPPCAIDLVDGTASAYADDNALDDTSNVDDVMLDLDAQEVTVDTSTSAEGGGTQILYKLAGVLGLEGDTVHAGATAVWGAPSSMKALPLTVGECEFDTNPIGADAVLFFHNGNPDNEQNSCPTNPANQDAPGGFGWLESVGCDATITIGTAPGDTGNSTPPDCDAVDFETNFLDADVAIPIYEAVTGQGANTVYTIAGFGAFHLTSYRLSGGPAWNKAAPGYVVPCSGDERCVGGYFTSFVTYDGWVGDAPDFGITAVHLTD